MSAVETGQMPAVETGQMSAAETGQMFAVETRQMCSIKVGQRPVAIVDICFVSTADICPVSAADICPVSTADICPVSTCTSKDRKATLRSLVNFSMQDGTKRETVSWKLSAAFFWCFLVILNVFVCNMLLKNACKNHHTYVRKTNENGPKMIPKPLQNRSWRGSGGLLGATLETRCFQDLIFDDFGSILGPPLGPFWAHVGHFVLPLGHHVRCPLYERSVWLPVVRHVAVRR